MRCACGAKYQVPSTKYRKQWSQQPAQGLETREREICCPSVWAVNDRVRVVHGSVGPWVRSGSMRMRARAACREGSFYRRAATRAATTVENPRAGEKDSICDAALLALNVFMSHRLPDDTQNEERTLTLLVSS
jgi:hypothetical protein